MLPDDGKPDRPKLDIKAEMLKRSTLFSCLTDEEAREIAPHASFRHYRKDEFIFHQGDSPLFLYVVVSGKVKQFKVSISGRTFTSAIMSSGDPLNAVALFGGKTYYVSAQAMNQTAVLFIPRVDFMSFVEKYPKVTTALVKLLGRILNSAYERLTDFAGEMAYQRIFNILYMLYFKFGDTVPVTREEIADMAGTTTETAIRVLGEMKKLGVIDSSRGRIVILDEAKLGNMSQRSYLIHQPEVEEQGGPG